MGQRWLAIDTSSRRGSLALEWEGELRQGVLLDSRAHASDLLPELERMLQSVGAERVAGVLPFSAIVVGTGPGSYTGLRIGIATARSLAWASGARLIGVPSFEAMAYAALAPGQSAAIAQDARAGRFYFARYRREPGTIQVEAEPQLLTKRELAAALEDETRILADPGLAKALELSASQASKLLGDPWPSASALLELGRERIGRTSQAPVEPLYLRAFGEN